MHRAVTSHQKHLSAKWQATAPSSTYNLGQKSSKKGRQALGRVEGRGNKKESFLPVRHSPELPQAGLKPAATPEFRSLCGCAALGTWGQGRSPRGTARAMV